MKLQNRLKFATLLFIAIIGFIAFPQEALAQTKKLEKTKQKAENKQYKEKMKEYNKEGWKLAGGSRTLEVALLEHYEKTADEKNQEFIGDVSQCKSINVCRQSALNNAQNRYASLASGNIKGRVTSLLRANANVPQEEVDKMIAAYERAVQVDVSGILKESYSIVKENANGTKSFQTIYIVNEETASAARLNAMKQSLKETKITIDEMEQILKFVDEGFSIE